MHVPRALRLPGLVYDIRCGEFLCLLLPRKINVLLPRSGGVFSQLNSTHLGEDTA
jgi:hypothetical protein